MGSLYCWPGGRAIPILHSEHLGAPWTNGRPATGGLAWDREYMYMYMYMYVL